MSVIELNNDNFDEVIGGDKPVLVDFWATWCMPCRMEAPIVEELAGEAEEKYVVGKVDVDANPEIAAKFNVMSIPTLIVFKDGEEAERTVGVTQKDELLKMIDGVKVN